MPQQEALWYRFQNPHPNGPFPERFEDIPSTKERAKRDADDAERLKSLRKLEAQTQARACTLRATRDQHDRRSVAFARTNVLYVETLNEVVDIQERIQALFVEQEAA